MGDNKMNDYLYLDGPWRNYACMGYAAMAMQREGIGDEIIERVLNQMIWCFDDTSVEDAAHYCCGRGNVSENEI